METAEGQAKGGLMSRIWVVWKFLSIKSGTDNPLLEINPMFKKSTTKVYMSLLELAVQGRNALQTR